MRHWTTDATAEADSRLPRWFRWLARSEAPDWLVEIAFWVATR